MSGKTAFVTGGTGFIGSHLVESLLKRAYSEVRCLIRSKPKWLKGIDIVPVRATLMDRAAILDAVRDVDYVYHLGGVTRAPDWDALYEGNVTATLNLLEAIQSANSSIKKVCVTSTLAVVGQTDEPVPDETSALNPVSRYGRSKALMEEAIWHQFKDALPITIIRPSSVYGPREKDIYNFFETVSRGICPILRGDPGLSLVHAFDLVRGIIDATESESTFGETYFLGSDEVVTWAMLRAATLDALQRKALTVHMPRMLVRPLGAVSEIIGRISGNYPPLNREKAREILFTAKVCSSAKAQRDFGYQQQVSLQEGVKAAIDWYRVRGDL